MFGEEEYVLEKNSRIYDVSCVGQEGGEVLVIQQKDFLKFFMYDPDSYKILVEKM